MGTFIQDLRYGLRMLARNPGFTAVAVLTLALGIGANTAIFSVVNAVLLRPLPYKDPGRLISVYETIPAEGLFTFSMSPANFIDLREQNKVFEDMAAIREADLTLAGKGEPERIQGQRVSANLFPILGVQPALGRAFLPGEDQPGGDSVAILSYGLWQRRFGADPALVGKTLTLDGQSYTVIGVMPRAFRFCAGFWDQPKNVDLWLPNPFKEDPPTDRWGRFYYVVARLKAGVSLERAQAEMDTIARRLQEAYPETNAGRGVNLIPLASDLTQYVQQSVLVLVGSVGFVLLLACANVANLLLARAATRQKEIAVRAAMGASRWRLVRQMLTESVLVGIVGGAVGLMIAVWGVDALVRLSPANIPRRDEISVDAWVLGFTLLITLLTGLIFGLAPALAASKPDLNESLKEAGKVSGERFCRSRLRSFLVVSEVAVALVLLMGAGLMINSFLRLQRVALGFRPKNVLAVQMDLVQSTYYQPSGIGTQVRPEGDGLLTKGRRLWTVRPQETAFIRQVLQRIQALPSVVSAAKINFVPVYGWHWGSRFTVEGRPPVTPEDSWQQLARFLTITPEYFRAMGIPLLRGRLFTEKDMVEAPGVVIIDGTMARRFFPKEAPIRKRLMVEDKMEDGGRLHEIVGVVGSVPQDRLDKDLDPAMYVPQPQQDRTYVDYQLHWRRHVSFVIQTVSNPMRLAPGVRKAVWEVDPDQPIESISTMEHFVSDTLNERRFHLLLLAIFASVALILATVGIYGVISYSIAQRTHEIGVRMALGAARRDVLKLVVGQGMVPVLIGVVVGTAGAFALTRFLSSMLYGVRPTDPATFLAVVGLVTGVALLACYIPARRATKVDPMVALRYE